MPIDIMVEILKRLPVKCILRFRCVCKRWHSLTQEYHFICRHRESWRNRPTLGIIALSWDPQKGDFSLYYIFSNYISSKGWQRFDLAGLYNAESFYMSNSCNGLVCLYGPDLVYVMNPSIREALVLPRAEGLAVALALGHDESTDEYKVVRLFKREERSARIECQILTLGSRSSWRAVENATLYVLHFSLPVVVNGAIHWGVGHVTENGIVLSFNIKDERFKVIMPPKAMPEFRRTEVTELGGKLSLSVANPNQPRRKIIWILHEYEKCRWVRESFYLNYIGRNEALKAIPMAEHKGKVVWSTGMGRLDCYDRKTGVFLTPMYINGTSTAPFVESLVSPIGIHQKGEDGTMGKRGRGLRCSEQAWDHERCFKRLRSSQ